MSWFKKEKREAPSKPRRIAVHCPDGETIVHYAAYRTIHPNGRLCLHDSIDGNGVVADYQSFAWQSISNGTRKVSS